MSVRVAFALDPGLESHVDELFGTHLGIIKLPGGVSFEPTEEEGVEFVTLDGVRDADRANRGCQMADGPKHCKLYRAQACNGDGKACLIEDAMSRES